MTDQSQNPKMPHEEDDPSMMKSGFSAPMPTTPPQSMKQFIDQQYRGAVAAPAIPASVVNTITLPTPYINGAPAGGSSVPFYPTSPTQGMESPQTTVQVDGEGRVVLSFRDYSRGTIIILTREEAQRLALELVQAGVSDD